MKLIPIDDPDDQRLTPYRSVGDAALLSARGQFVAEGRLVVQRVLADPRLTVVSLMVTDTALSALQAAWALGLPSLAADADVFICALPAFRAVTGFNIHRGCLALVERPRAAGWRALLRKPLESPSVRSPGSSVVLVLENVTDADNVGSVFRNAAAFGAAAVLLSPTCCDPLYRKAVRTSMAATLHVPSARFEPWPESLNELKAEGYTLAALTPREPARPLAEFAARPRPQRLALLVGSEGPGLSDAAMNMADHRLRIPITSAVDSLNLGVASGIALALLTAVAPTPGASRSQD